MTNIQKRGWPKEKTMPSARNAAHFLLAESSIDHLAYSVLDRTGHISHLPFCLALFWHSAWEVMKMKLASEAQVKMKPASEAGNEHEAREVVKMKAASENEALGNCENEPLHDNDVRTARFR